MHNIRLKIKLIGIKHEVTFYDVDIEDEGDMFYVFPTGNVTALLTIDIANIEWFKVQYLEKKEGE